MRTRHTHAHTLMSIHKTTSLNNYEHKEVDPKTHTKLKQTLFIQTKQDRMQIFWVTVFLKAMNDTKTNKSLSFCRQQDSCIKKELGTRLYLLPSEGIQLVTERTVICFCIVCSFEKEDFLEHLHPVLFCLIRKCSF